jgi:hypothetical protein
MNSHAMGAVTAGFGGAAGGLVGLSLCCTGGLSITNSYATGAVSGYNAGGLISNLLPGETISGSHATGTVVGDGTSHAGGLVGYSGGTIVNSYASGDVSQSGDQCAGGAGGLAGGGGAAVISSSFATGSVTGPANASYYGCAVGGLVGNSDSQTHISDVYATGDAKASEYVGGLIGTNNGRAKQAYETGAVSQGQVTGGAMGQNHESSTTRVSSVYWDTTTSGQTKGVGKGQVGGITGLTDGQLKSGLPAGFDPSIWTENPSINGGLPYLLSNPPPP